MDLYIALTFPAVRCKRTRTTFIDLRRKAVVPDPGAIASDRRKHQVPNNNVSAVANLFCLRTRTKSRSPAVRNHTTYAGGD